MDPAFDSPRNTFSMKLPFGAAPPPAPTGQRNVLRPNSAAMHNILQGENPEP